MSEEFLVKRETKESSQANLSYVMTSLTVLGLWEFRANGSKFHTLAYSKENRIASRIDSTYFAKSYFGCLAGLKIPYRSGFNLFKV